MKKPIVVGLWILLLVIIVLAAVPDTPEITSPANQSVFMDETFSITCDSTDGLLAADIYHEIYARIVNQTWDTTITMTDIGNDNAVIANSMNKAGVRILIGNPNGTYLQRTYHAAAAGPLAAYLYTDDYDLIEKTKIKLGDAFVFDNPYLEYETYYRIEMDRDGVTYNQRYKTPGDFPYKGTDLNWTTGSINGSNDIKLNNIINVYTREKNFSEENYMVSNSTDETVTIMTWITPGYNSSWWCIAGNATSGEVAAADSPVVQIHGLNFTNSSTGGVDSAIKLEFLDEGNGSSLDASLNLFNVGFNSTDAYEFSTIHTALHKNYYFLLQPKDFYITVFGNVSAKSGTDYPLRHYLLDEEIIGNYTLNKTLYLLYVDDGVEDLFNVEDVASAKISGVKIQVSRQGISGTSGWAEVSTSFTGDDGAATFWLNPDYQHRVVLSKAGYSTVTAYIWPSSQGHTFKMGIISENASYSASTEGMLWTIGPPNGPVSTGIMYDFEFNITATLGNLVYCAMNITNSTGDVVANAEGCNAAATYYGENISDTYTINTNDTLFGTYWITVDATCDDNECDSGINKGEACATDAECEVYGIIYDGAYWVEFPFNFSEDYGLKAFFISFRDIDEFGEGKSQEASRIIFFFIFATIIIGAISFFTGIELQNPGMVMGIVTVIILMASLAGFFEINIFLDDSNMLQVYLEKYSLAIISGMFAIGLVCDDLRRRHVT